jgi:two-component system chemotaxis response regulator CheY
VGKILVVDDSVFVGNTISSVVKDLGHELLLANDGEQGLKTMRENKIDLVFSDYNMPIMKGLEMVAQMKQDESLKYIPIVMLTTEDSEDKINAGRELGVQAWMVKPFKKDKVEKAIRRILG